MQLIADLHTHTLCATHAYHTLDEMAAAAKDCGYRALAITDHAPAMPDAPHRWHFENPTALPRTIGDVIMLYGAEANVVDTRVILTCRRASWRIRTGWSRPSTAPACRVC